MFTATLLEVIQSAVGIVFLFSAVGKARHPNGFVNGVVAYQILPGPLSVMYGIVLIPLEAFVATSLLFGWLVRLGISIGLFLLCSFFVAVAINVRRDRDLSCYCFGDTSTERISRRSLVRIGLLIGATLGMMFGHQLLGNHEQISSPIHLLVYGNTERFVAEFSISTFILLSAAWALSVQDLLRIHEAANRTAE